MHIYFISIFFQCYIVKINEMRENRCLDIIIIIIITIIFV